MAKLIIVALLFTGIFFPRSAPASSVCKQTFTVYGKTAGEHGVLFWDVYSGGECITHEIQSLYLDHSKAHALTTTGSGSESWNRASFIDSFLASVPCEVLDTLQETNGTYFINDSFFFKPPAIDTTFTRKFHKMIEMGGNNARDWYRKCPVNCSDYPTFQGVAAKLIHEYKDGLYKNYVFSQVIFFRQSGYLILVTDQPMRSVGMNTMHGMLVYWLDLEGNQVK